jgi:transposase
MHTLLDLRGNIPTFIHISDGKLHDVNVLDVLVPEAGAIYIMDRGYLDFERLHTMHRVGAFFITRAKSNTRLRRVYSAATDRTTERPASSATKPLHWSVSTAAGTARSICAASASKTPKQTRH